MPLRQLEFAWKTDKGKVRAQNEDAVAVCPERGLVVVADGIGGASAGEVASDLATRIVRAKFEREEVPPATAEAATKRAEAAVNAANQAIWEMASRDPNLEGMGTTVVTGYVWNDWLVFAHVGDSRLYRLRDGELTQLTKDHSLIQQVVDLGFFSDLEQARRCGISQNVLTRGLGTANPVAVDSDKVPLQAGDLYLFCTDGLTGMVSDLVLAEILATGSGDLEALSSALVDCACDSGGVDNVTVALMRVSS